MLCSQSYWHGHQINYKYIETLVDESNYTLSSVKVILLMHISNYMHHLPQYLEHLHFDSRVYLCILYDSKIEQY
jgi:hypothetical protein